MSSTTLRIRGYRDKEPRVGQRQQQREIVMKSHLTSLTKAREGKKAKGGRGWRPAGDGGSLVVVAAVVVAVAVVVDVSLVVVIFFSTEMTMRRYEGAVIIRLAGELAWLGALRSIRSKKGNAALSSRPAADRASRE